jgi:hypothetical protein
MTADRSAWEYVAFAAGAVLAPVGALLGVSGREGVGSAVIALGALIVLRAVWAIPAAEPSKKDQANREEADHV